MDRGDEGLRAVRLWQWSFSVVVALVVSSAAPPHAFGQSQAEMDERCQRHVQHAEHELHEAIERYGRHSREADHERRWHDQRDWDDRDHDRD